MNLVRTLWCATYSQMRRRTLYKFPLCAKALPAKTNINLRCNNLCGETKTVLFCGILGFFGMQKDSVPSEEENLEKTIKLAILAVQEGNMERADKLLHVALKLANDLQHQAAITHIYCLMANLALERGFLRQAERLFTNVLQRILAEGEAQESNAVVDISLKLAKIFVANNDLHKAEQGFKFCTEAMAKKIRNSDADEDSLALFGMSLDQYAQFCMSRNNLKEAERLFEEAVVIAKKLHGMTGEQTLVVTNSLATVLSMQGKDVAAAQLMESVIVAARRIDTPHITSFLVNYGLVQLKLGVASRAKESCDEAKKKSDEVGDREVKAEAEHCLRQVNEVLTRK